MNRHLNPHDSQPPHVGKFDNDTNKEGEPDPTPSHHGQRTPASRSDRSSDQSQARRGPTGSPKR